MIKITACAFLFAFLYGCSNDSGNGGKADPLNTPVKKQPLSLKKETPNPFAIVDVSPMDMSYCPANYPMIKHLTGDQPDIRLIYSRPQRQGRAVFGNIVQYDTIWRLGANEGTEIEFFKPATIQGNKIKPGRYILYCIPKKDSWQVVLNTDADIWGLNIDTAKDAAKFTIPVTYTTSLSEYFTAIFENTPGGANLVFAWDDVVARLPIAF
jgi:Protein of unknown function (DUF2911)